ncbi:MAG TPA: hypothetical protein VMV18_09520 [bacterium]|nr:hypothetical protein [bacterium]
MTNLFRRRIAPALAAVVSLSSFAFEARATEPAAAGAAPEHAREAGEGYDVGVIGHFMTGDPIIKIFYDRSEAIDGPTVGVFVTRRRPNGFRITGDIAYTTFSPKDGPWLGAGKDKSASEWTEFRQGSSKGFSMVSADFILGHDFNTNETFGFYVGGGIGLIIPMGKVTGYDTTGANFDQNAGTNPDNKLKSVPPVIPMVIFKMGPTVNIGGKATLGVETGLQDGLFVGLSLGMRL